MKAAQAVRAPLAQPEWFEAWFDSPYYHALYAGRDHAEAAALIDRLIARLRPADGAAVLDLGCGTGRHARYLASRRLRVLGLDLSGHSISQARQREQPNLRFRRHDMRLAFGVNAFDYIVNLFTSFGYFEEPAEHLTVVRNIARALKPGGRVVLDYLNVRHAERHLIPEELIDREGIVFRISRSTNAGHIVKRIVVERDGDAPLEYVERVARFTLEDFRLMFALYDMKVEETYGDYALAPFDVQTSPRLILVARRMDGRSAALPARQMFPDAADGLGRHAEIGREHRLRHAERNRGIDPQELEVALLGRGAQ
jgi:SAM-dependent methyltransferase